MSGKATGWAWDQKGLAPRTKMVLLAIADFCDIHGYGTRPRSYIAEQAECSVDTVDRCLKELESAKLVFVDRGENEKGQSRGQSTYMLAMHPAAKLRLGSDDVAADPSRETAAPQPHLDAAPQPHTVRLHKDNGYSTVDHHGGDSAREPDSNPPLEGLTTETLSAFVDRVYLEVNDNRLCRHRSVNLAASETHLARWINAGIDRDAVIIPTLKAVMANRKDPHPVNGWNYFDRPMAKAHQQYLESLKPFDLGEPIEPTQQPRRASQERYPNGRNPNNPLEGIRILADRAREFERRDADGDGMDADGALLRIGAA